MGPIEIAITVVSVVAYFFIGGVITSILKPTDMSEYKASSYMTALMWPVLLVVAIAVTPFVLAIKAGEWVTGKVVGG